MTDEVKPPYEGTTRRPLLKLAAGGAALASVGVGARLTLHPDGDERIAGDAGEGSLVLSTHADTDVKSLELPLGDEVLPRAGRARWESRRLPTSVHSMVAFTWGVGSPEPQVSIRSRTGGAWQEWQRVPLLHDLPEEVAEEGAAGVIGTDLVWIGRADGIQIRTDGARPTDLTLVLLYPSPRAIDPLLGRSLLARTDSSEAAAAGERVRKPDLVTREEWGADASWRDGRPTYNRTIKQVHVHHTVNANNYSRGDVPGLIRGMYRYHTHNLGWSDIGYNFLVDRFGRGWVGRAGGPSKLVRGAHTLGFNAESTGISAIGNYDTARPSDGMLDAIAAIAAWKLDRFDRHPRGKVNVVSEGSDKYRAGRTARLPVIDGHRDTNDTACPGGNLYGALPKVRRRAARLIRASRQSSVTVDRAASIAGTARLGGQLRADPGSYRPGDAKVVYRWFRDARPIRGAREQTYDIRPWDVGHRLTCQVELRKRGLDPAVQKPPRVGPITAAPELSLTTSVRRRVVRVHVRLGTPKNVRAVPGGKVSVTVGKRTRTGRLENGAVVVRFGGHRRLGKGRFPVKVTYAGNRAFTAVKGKTSVRVS